MSLSAVSAYVNTYSDDDYFNVRGVYNQGDTVYAQGTHGDENDWLRIVFLYPNGNVAQTCDDDDDGLTECELDLAEDVQIGTWTAELQVAEYHSGYWTGPSWNRVWHPAYHDSFEEHESKTFEVVNSSQVIPTIPCTVNLFEPVEGGYYDPVTIRWEKEGTQCNPFHYHLQYTTAPKGRCYADGWTNILSNIDPAHAGTYEWDVSNFESGNYCVRVIMECAGGICPGCQTEDSSDVFNLDMTKPYVNLTVGTPQDEDCTEGEGTCYVNQNTDVTITCDDDNPDAAWQSGVDYIQYRITGPLGTTTQTVDGDEATFNFTEDSNHNLEYWCYDNVGKEAIHKTKNFVVESQAPIINRTVGQPQFCEEEDRCTLYVTTKTDICLFAVDPTPHPVDNVEIWCEYGWDSQIYPDLPLGNMVGPFKLENNECFNYGQDSYHTLHCWANDSLGNTNETYWFDIVDNLAPITDLSYTGPHYNRNAQYPNAQWIDGVSRVVLTANNGEQPHPVNGITTYYRYGIVSDSYCYGEVLKGTSLPTLTGEWVNYSTTGPFGMEESCHMIEYYSVDALGNTEEVQTEFVFVDKTAPELDVSVGNPSHKCTELDIFGVCEDGWDWKVTMQTPVTLSCQDSEPHPSGVQKLCYKVTWDGENINPEAYYLRTETAEDGYHCVDDDEVTLYFREECEHTLDFYCTDNVEKTSNVTTTVFKVEGYSFPLHLDKKWNLISVPVNLLSSDIEEVFGDDENIVGVWGYENGEWKVYIPGVTNEITEIVPGRGYWVKTTNDTTIVIGGELFTEATTPSSVQLEKGWNLIGHYGFPSKTAYCSLFSLVDTQEGFPRWSSLWAYNTMTDNFRPLGVGDYTFAGKGYWIEMDVEDTYSPSSICYGFDN